MAAYITRRLFECIFICVGVSIIVFGLMHLAGDPVNLLLSPESTKEDVELMRKNLGLDKPIHVQYWRFFKRAAVGDFGKSLFTKTDALELVFQRLPATIALTVTGLSLALIVAIPLGILSAVKRYSILDNLATITAVIGQAMPMFWLGIMLIIVFSVFLRVLPPSGMGSPAHFVLPSITLATFLAPVVMRMVRSRMLDILAQDYIRTAYSKGLHDLIVLLKHALRNAIIPVVAIIGLQFGRLLGGSIVAETVFAWPGVASLVVKGIRNYDYPVVQAATITFAVIIVLVNLTTDIVVAALDPRIKYK